MPFYEYQCANCGHHLEAMQKISDAPLKKCPACGKGQLKRLISAPVFRLKGAGWYETDFKTDKDSKRNLHGADDEAPKSAADATEAAKSPDKPADKATDKPADKAAAKPADKPTAGATASSSGKAGGTPRGKARPVSAGAARPARRAAPARAK